MRDADKVIKEHFKGAIVGAEIGVNAGVHAKEMLDAMPCLNLHLVDNGAEMATVDANNAIEFHYLLGSELKQYGKRVFWHIEDSHAASKGFNQDLDFVYIDADHHYAAVYLDCQNWYPKVKAGGIISGHDYARSIGDDVRRAVDTFFSEQGKVVHQGTDLDWWVFK